MLITTSMLTATFAQVSTYERQPGYWTLGLNGGFAYQQSDVPSVLDGYGLGLTLAKNLYYQPGSGLAFDLRGRGLYTKTFGLDYFQSSGIDNNTALNGTNALDYTKMGNGPGFVYQNNKTDHLELGLEGVVSFNKLREETNVILSLFGGIGLDWYNTKIDQADANGIYYSQYEALDPTASVSYKKSQLRNAILDGVYETNAQGFEDGNGRLGIMPSLGFELGYQFTPKFSMGLGHKVTFTKTDLFDGQQWTNDNTLTGNNDIHHYTNLYMRWILEKKEKELKPPVINIIKPEIDPFTTRDPNGYIKASIKYVESAMDVRFTVNGYAEQFNFKNEGFSSTFRLQPGRNDILITASNLAGTDQETVVIFYEEPIIVTQPQGKRPTVNITNPAYDNFRTDNERFVVKATINNVYNKQDILFTIDGREYRNFTFDSRSNTFTAAINLDEGQNDLRIEARNNIGNDIDEATIILEKVFQQLPSVDIYKPFENPFYTPVRRVVLEAKVYHVDSKDDIRFTINGRRSSDFNYKNETLYATIDLYDYKTIVVIEGSNTAGTASDDIIIFLEEQEEEPEIDAPVVTITSMSQPTIDPFDPDNCRSTVIATILNVESEHDISFIVNGKKYYDFSFNANTGVLQKTIKLQKGNNEVVIKAQNEAGNDEDRATKEGCFVVENPPVVTITTPNNISTTVTQPKAKIIATVLNIKSKNDINFVVNGRTAYNFTFDPNTKVFSATISLALGNNTAVIIAENRDGRAEDIANIVYKKPKVELALPPLVTIYTPVNNTNTTVKEVTLEAKVSNINRKNDIEVYLNGQRTTSFNFNTNSQIVNAQISLSKGNNTIRVKATNKDGVDEKSVRVTYTPPVPVPPVVKFTQPIASVSNTTNPDVSISASVKNVKGINDINVTINGRRSFDFTFKNNVVNANFKLNEGRNTIMIVATNRDGSADDQRLINYKAPVILPIVKITTPQNNINADQPKTTVKATVKNVINQKDIKLLVNGQSKPFTFFKNTLSSEVILDNGKNIILVSASNKDGSADDQKVVNYKAPVIPPVVIINTPKTNTSTDKSKTTVKATVKNVINQKDIKLLVNGQSTRFTFFRNVISADLVLNKGENKILVKAANKDGRDEATVTVTYSPPLPKPTVVFITPKRIGTSVKNIEATIEAIVQHVSNKKDITIKVNGKILKVFTFQPRTNKVSAKINLTEGVNSLFIEGRNTSGTASANSSMKFVKPIVQTINPPKVQITSVSEPTVDPFDPNKAKSTIIAKMENITEKNQITFTVNGKTNSSFSFDVKTQMFQSTINLRKGKTRIKIKVGNPDGSHEASRTITF